jgi:ferredoxin-NADP reductase
MNSEPTTHLVKLKSRFSAAERTMAFQFEKPANFAFRPGQWIDSTLPSKRAPKDMRKELTLKGENTCPLPTCPLKHGHRASGKNA